MTKNIQMLKAIQNVQNNPNVKVRLGSSAFVYFTKKRNVKLMTKDIQTKANISR